MKRPFIILALTLITVVFYFQKSIAQNITENYCLKEQERTRKMRMSIIMAYTRGERVINQATADRMANNIEIAIARQCESAIKRGINRLEFQRESENILRNVVQKSVHDEHFDLTNSAILERFLKNMSVSIDKGAD
jgi:hypothetical protein